MKKLYYSIIWNLAYFLSFQIYCVPSIFSEYPNWLKTKVFIEAKHKQNKSDPEKPLKWRRGWWYYLRICSYALTQGMWSCGVSRIQLSTPPLRFNFFYSGLQLRFAYFFSLWQPPPTPVIWFVRFFSSAISILHFRLEFL